jgi:hypothetical protein
LRRRGEQKPNAERVAIERDGAIEIVDRNQDLRDRCLRKFGAIEIASPCAKLSTYGVV